MSVGREPAELAAGEASIWTPAFLAILTITFLSNCNMAVFFQFHSYLVDLDVPGFWQGPLISALSMVGLFIRPVISPFINTANARRWILWGCLGSALMLALYNFAFSPWTLMAVRLLHGLAYVALVTGLTAATVGIIPPGRSGQAFGAVGIVVVLPFAVVPPLAVLGSRLLGGFLPVLDLTALALGLSLGLMLLLPAGAKRDDAGARQPGKAKLSQSLHSPSLVRLLASSLLVFTAYGSVFFYVEPYAHDLGMANAGWYFTVNTVAELAVRVFCGRAFDRYPKRLLLGGALVLLVLAFLALAAAQDTVLVLASALFLGLGLGAAMPLFTALIFDTSPPEMRALNTNLNMLMFQAGLFLGPLGAGWLVHLWTYGAMYLICAGLCACALLVASFIAPAATPAPTKLEE